MKTLLLIGMIATIGLSSAVLRAAEATPAKPPEKKPTPAALDRLRALAGTWVSKPVEAMGNKPMTVTFKVTANDSAVVETMFPGTDHEMVNMYYADGDGVMMTHYCGMGVQPRMRLAPADDRAKVMKFSFVDCTNLKSRDEAHMDSVDMTIDGDKLVEDWSYYQDGKVINHVVLELKKQR